MSFAASVLGRALAHPPRRRRGLAVRKAVVAVTRTVAMAAMATLVACGGSSSDGAAAVDDKSWRANAKVSLESPGANCAHGGSRIEAGIDINRNGMLDAGEVMSVQFACHGNPGVGGSSGAAAAAGAVGSAGANALVRIDAEPAGANCAHAGSKVSAGLDANGNGVLDTGEVGSTRYVCASAIGASGSNGSNGNHGTNGNQGANGSNGSPGLNGLIVIVNEPAGAHCADGGKKVTTGLDANNDSVLGAGEVAATSYLCNAALGPGMVWTAVSGTSQAMAANIGYLATHATQVTLTLPASPALGEVVSVNGVGFGGWKIAQNAGQFITARNVPNDGSMGSTWRSTGPALDWRAVASSADGSRLIAAGWNEHLYTSVDGGATWMAREASRTWSGVTSSADGSKLVAAERGGQIHTSTDFGDTWTPRASALEWSAVASSADGTKLVAAVYGGQIHTSVDAGANWTARDSARNWTSVASSEDGARLVATAFNGQIHTSTDSGASWTAQGPTASWTTVASSADGTRLIAAGQSVQIHLSTDSGANWTTHAGNRFWRSVASSADGSKLVAVPEGDVLFISTDAGLTWPGRASSRNWRAVASSSDGSRLAAVAQNAQAQTSLAGRSSPGTAGAISGTQYDMLTLQYIGGGEFIPIDYATSGAFHVE